MPDDNEPVKHNVRVIVSSLGSERRNIVFKDMDEKRIQDLIQTVNNAFGVIRQSDALLLTGSDGQIVFANLDNVAFVEVHID